MRAFFAACAAAILLGVVAAVVLNGLGMDSATQFSTPSVRL